MSTVGPFMQLGAPHWTLRSMPVAPTSTPPASRRSSPTVFEVDGTLAAPLTGARLLHRLRLRLRPGQSGRRDGHPRRRRLAQRTREGGGRLLLPRRDAHEQWDPRHHGRRWRLPRADPSERPVGGHGRSSRLLRRQWSPSGGSRHRGERAVRPSAARPTRARRRRVPGLVRVDVQGDQRGGSGDECAGPRSRHRLDDRGPG